MSRSFWAWRQWLREQMHENHGPALAAAEPPADYRNEPPGAGRPEERLIQAIWAQQLVQPASLRLMDGRPLRVLDAGRRNGSAGPDFLGARLMFGPEIVEGAVEVHVEGREWFDHGHQRDLDYNAVVLHVVLSAGDGRAADPLHNGLQVPRLELEPFVFPDLETIRRSFTPDDYEYAAPAGVGRCHRLMTRIEAPALAEFLDRAGEERLISKTRRLEQQAQAGGAGSADDSRPAAEQIFYQSLMMTLGSGSGRTLYYLLSRRVPLTEAVDYVRELPESRQATGFEALLLHVAGLVPADTELKDAPAEAREHAAGLRDLWETWRPCWSDRVIPPARRWYQGIRPVNFPVRRLAGVAVLLARAMRRGGFCAAAPEGSAGPLEMLTNRIYHAAPSLAEARPTRRRHPLLEELVGELSVAGAGHFWGSHYSFTARPSVRVMDLIGEGTALSLVLNALLPAALWLARRRENDTLQTAVQRLFAIVPPLQSNHITEFMTRRLFGEDAPAHRLLNTERRRQALFQIFYECCKGESADCNACHYFAER